MQSALGFKPEVPEYLGQQTGYRDVPLNLERFYDVTTPTGNEPPRQETRTVDRLDNYRAMEDLAGYLSGPEGNREGRGRL